MSPFIFFIVVVLWSGCFGAWLRHLTRRQIDPRKWTDCKLYYFLFYFGRHYSSMLLVLMSVEKCFAVYFPLKSMRICTVRTAKWATGISGIVLASYDLVYFKDIESFIIKSSGRHICVLKGDYLVILNAIDSVLYSFGPFTLMVITNIAIVLKFMRAKCTAHQTNATESTNQALAKSATRGTTMVVIVSVTFLLLTAPVGVDNAISYFVRLGSTPQYKAFMNLTQYLNHNINGVLYIIVGSKFRKELVDIFKGKQHRRNNTISTRNTSVTNLSGDAIRSKRYY